MKFSIGDPVYIISNKEEGVIEEFIGKDMASVLVNGKSYYVYLEDMEHPYLRWFLSKNQKEKKKTPYIDQLSVEKNFERKAVLPTGIYLVCMPVYKLDGFDEVVEKVKVFFYNETFYQYRFEYSCKVQGAQVFNLDSDLLPESEFYLHDVAFEEMAKSPIFNFRFVDEKDAKLDNENLLTIKPKKLFEKIDEIKYANNAFFYFLLFEKLTIREKKTNILPESNWKMPQQNVKETRHFSFEEVLKTSGAEIDLHIEKLVPDFRGLSSGEILSIQLHECQRAVDLAYATHQRSLIIIHGIGKGVLKTEISLLLNQTKGVKEYVNEYDVRYGYGATKVFFGY